jgi:hypothetical protein
MHARIRVSHGDLANSGATLAAAPPASPSVEFSDRDGHRSDVLHPNDGGKMTSCTRRSVRGPRAGGPIESIRSVRPEPAGCGPMIPPRGADGRGQPRGNRADRIAGAGRTLPGARADRLVGSSDSGWASHLESDDPEPDAPAGPRGSDRSPAAPAASASANGCSGARGRPTRSRSCAGGARRVLASGGKR